jgi:hypothetical protein
MDDVTFEQWSATLLELRQSRHDSIKLQIDERGKEYLAKDLFDHLMVSLDHIMSQWWDYERRSWETTPPADPMLAVETLRGELDSVADFEIDASDKDIDMARGLITITDDDIAKGHEDLQAFVADLKKNYSLKIDALLNSVKKASAPPVPAPSYSSVPRNSYSRPTGSGVGLVIMFIVGLGLGAGLAFFFRETAQKSIESLQEEKDKLASEKRQIISEFTELQETYFQLAHGKLMTLPELDLAMKPIKEEAAAKRRQAEIDFAKTKESILKKIPAGDRLDRSLERLAADKDARLKDIETQMNARLEKYIKQQQIHEDLMNKK